MPRPKPATQGHTIANPIRDKPIVTVRVVVIEGPDKGQIQTSQHETLTVGSASGNDLVLNDDTVSRYHLELEPMGAQVRVKDLGSTNGTIVGSVNIREATVGRGSVIRLGTSSIRIEDGESITIDTYPHDNFHGMRGRSGAMRRLMARLDKVASSNASVLLLGETGTGKEVMARAVHQASSRAKAPFEIVDCGALMPTLVASELFGHEKGSFTGAHQRHIGAFERAHGGTIFLDEIGELTPNLQVQLLGVLERRRLRRVGGTQNIDVDVRLVCATHRDLREYVNQGKFRQDLYYRIAVVQVAAPPLRERTDDIPLLVEHFTREMGLDGPLEQHIPVSMLETLTGYQWPGNVRELRNFVESAIAFGEPPPLDRNASSGTSRASGASGTADADDDDGALSIPHQDILGRPYKDARDLVLHQFQTMYFEDLLARAGDNVTRAAAKAKMNRPHMVQILKRLGLRD